MELAKLATILSDYFGPPFLVKGQVRSELQKDGTLKIWIGRRDIHINDDGVVLGAGTCLSQPVIDSPQAGQAAEGKEVPLPYSPPFTG